MGHPPRLDAPGDRHHVFNRGARRQDVFGTDAACAAFLSLVAELPRRFGVTVHAYAIMPNHFHLLLSCPRGGLGRAMQFLQSRFSLWLNRCAGWDGPVWRARYGSRCVEDDAWWLHLPAYIHLNPVRDGLDSTRRHDHWTSRMAYEGEIPCPEWLETSSVLQLHGGRAAYQRYQADVQRKREAGPEGFEGEPASRAGGVRRAEVFATFDARNARVARPLTLEEAWGAVVEWTGLSRRQLTARGRGGVPSPKRRFAMWFLAKTTEAKASEIARAFGVGPAVVSRAANTANSADFAEPALVERARQVLGCAATGDYLALLDPLPPKS